MSIATGVLSQHPQFDPGPTQQQVLVSLVLTPSPPFDADTFNPLDPTCSPAFCAATPTGQYGLTRGWRMRRILSTRHLPQCRHRVGVTIRFDEARIMCNHSPSRELHPIPPTAP
jgi:hypothetical protein